MFEYFMRNGISIDAKIATCLLTGLILSTRGFSNQNVTASSLKIASKLIELGANRENIIASLYQTKSISLLKSWGHILSELNYDP